MRTETIPSLPLTPLLYDLACLRTSHPNERPTCFSSLPCTFTPLKDSSPEGSPHLPPPRSLPPAPVTSPLDLAEETAGESTIEEEEGGMTEEDDENVEVEEEGESSPP